MEKDMLQRRIDKNTVERYTKLLKKDARDESKSTKEITKRPKVMQIISIERQDKLNLCPVGRWRTIPISDLGFFFSVHISIH